MGAASAGNLGISTTAGDGYSWDIPYDTPAGSFLLRKFGGTDYWYWDTGILTADLTYGTDATINNLGSDAQTVTFHISGLTTADGNYIKVTSGGTDLGQITATTPALSVGTEEVTSEGAATVTATIASSGGSEKIFTLTIQEYNSSGVALGTATVVTFTQGTSSYVVRSATASTRVKVLTLPKKTFTYKIVDLSGRIAVTASAEQTIFSPLSKASIPSIIVSPFILDETVTFYRTYGGSGRSNLTTPISETPNGNHDIFVKYTTTNLSSKPIQLSEDQTFYVKLNGLYIYYDSDGSIKGTSSYTGDDKYRWKLRNRDPYAMLIDNLGARVGNSVTGNETPNVYDDDGGVTTPDREKGAWVKLNSALPAIGDTDNGTALAFDVDRANAQPFIAKSSLYAGIYEVMVATGDGVDASTTYYNIGNTAIKDASIKIYRQDSYAHGNDVLSFRLEQPNSYSYHLIDMAKHELLTATSQSPDLVLPAEYQSPLVATYRYYDKDQFTISEGVYTLKGGATELNTLASLGEERDIYVTYEKNDLVKFNDTGSPYMLKFLKPYEDGYYLEDGNDILTSEKIQAVYPYTNGDGNLNIYGQAMNDEQMNGGSSTRPRWVWFFTNPAGYADDPYHVTIHSKSTIPYGGVDHPTYLQTYSVHFNQDAEDAPNRIVTGGSLPGIASVEPTEYMILGIQGNYKLLTTKVIDGERRYVKSFEQYWKTYNMVKQHLLGLDSDDPEDEKVVPSSKVEDLKAALTTKGINNSSDLNYVDGCSWHSYEAYANAVRWNGYTDEGKHNTKVVEKLEHWFQTFDMGDGSFDIISADIPPVLVLLDRHGWEIMRKPLPTKNYPYGEELDALRVYDSPMVEKYFFFSNATKAYGCHKYALRLQNGNLRDEIKVDGTPYTSTSLADLPPITATGVKSGGDFQDQFVVYTVKEEYEKSYTYSYDEENDVETATSSKFMVLQGGRFARVENEKGKQTSYFTKPIFEHSDPQGGNIYDVLLNPRNASVTILDGVNIKDENYYYLQPNLNIDEEMGIKWSNNKDKEPFTKKETKALYADTSKKAYWLTTGFDPYNLQLKNAGATTSFESNGSGGFMTTHITKTSIENGAMVGSYDGGNLNITLEKEVPTVTTSEGYDHTNIAMTNQTFMVVSDANGNMQLMPRFDHSKRVNTAKANPFHTTLEDPVDHTQLASADDNNSMGPQTVLLVRPQIFEYHIIDNEGNEALRYKRAGDYFPAITDHFKSPLAKDFTFYKTLADGIVSNEITGSFAGAGYTDLTGNDVYVRYSYDEEADIDDNQILQGKWFTIALANKDVQSTETTINADGDNVFLYSGTKPGTINAEEKKWQWKFLVAPIDPSSELHRTPDPYAIQLFNRQANYSTDLTETSPMSVPIKVNGANRFSLLSHPDGGYALAVNGLGTYTYSFLNGASMTDPDAAEPQAATTVAESVIESDAKHFTIKSNALSPGAQLIVNNDVKHNYTYKVINNSKKLAVEGTQTDEAAAVHNYSPYLPETAQTLLLNPDEDYTYYGSATVDGSLYSEVASTKLFTLHGLYNDEVYVRYKAYDAKTTPFHLPNMKDVDGSGNVIKHSNSNDVAMNIKGELPYNIVWVADNMMKKGDSDAITYQSGQSLSGNDEFVWYFTGDDPYGLKIKHKGGKYVNGTTTLETVAENASPSKTFMLLKKSGYDYGILQETGTSNKLTGIGDGVTTSDPTKFIIFGLSTHKLVYHLVINKTNLLTIIPYRTGDEKTYDGSVAWDESDTIKVTGTTQRDLTSQTSGVVGDQYQLGETFNGQTYCYDAGQISIGDVLQVPTVFYRPNCTFEYYIDGIWDTCNDAAKTLSNSNTSLNNKYKGLKLEKLMSDDDLINKTVVVNIVYSFNKDLTTNSGLDFVRNTGQNLWYTLETQNASVPYLVRYTNTQGLKAIGGRSTRYTNDYLFTPVGDVYGFKMYNRYTVKNSDEANGNVLTKVMTTTALADDQAVTIAKPASGYEVYELTAGDVDGYFRIHPVVNNTSTRYYVNMDGDMLELSTTPRDWTFGLDMAMLQPYYLSAGYVGGLNDTGKTAYENEIAKGTGKDGYKITDLQAIVYNDDNIVHFSDGYYRLHSQPSITGISPVRYASGYLHDIEKTAISGGIPMHFYSKEGVSTTFGDEGLKTGYTVTAATQGDIPIDATEYDPSTVFYVSGSNLTNKTISHVTLSTQGLKVIENKMGEGTATTFTMVDIGGGVVTIFKDVNSTREYLNFDQTDAADIYDLKFDHSSRLDDVKWCVQPANNLGLKVKMNSGGDEHYYATFYAPFDVTITNEEADAFVCTEWNTTNLHPTNIGKSIPAGTPVIIRSSVSGDVAMTLPGTTATSPTACVFKGEYLEQMLSGSNIVYTFGLPFTSEVTFNPSSGEVTTPLAEKATTGVGFYINANPYKEHNPLQSMWLRNNRYVLHNKIYFRASASGVKRLGALNDVNFIPVVFDDDILDEQMEEETGETQQTRIDGDVYDLSGRKVATEQQVNDGTWRQILRPGIYIVGGKKIKI